MINENTVIQVFCCKIAVAFTLITCVVSVLCVCVCLWVYLHIENGEDANLVSQHAFCPVIVHSPDYCQYLILHREEVSE